MSAEGWGGGGMGQGSYPTFISKTTAPTEHVVSLGQFMFNFKNSVNFGEFFSYKVFTS